MQTQSVRIDRRVLATTGALLFLLAAVFTWRDLQLPPSVLAALAAVIVASVSISGVDRRLPLVAPVAMVLLVLAAGGWYAAIRDPILLIPLTVMFLASLGMVAREPGEAEDKPRQVRRVLVWYGFVLATVAATWAAYFHFVTLRFPDGEESRRLLLTAAWVIGGVVLVLLSRWRHLPASRDAGFALLACGVGKLVFYDSGHLHGLERVAGLVGAGSLLLAGAWITGRIAPRVPVRSEVQS